MMTEQYRKFLMSSSFGFASILKKIDNDNNDTKYLIVDFNDSFESMLGLSKMQISELPANELLSNISGDKLDWQMFFSEVFASSRPVIREYYFESLKKWFMVNASAADNNYLIIYFTDITREKNSEEMLNQQSDFLQFGYVRQETLAEIALEFKEIKNFDSQINKVLSSIGNHTGVSRVYIFEDNETGETTSNVYEWCNENIAPQKDTLQNIPYTSIQSWKDMLQNDGKIYSENIKELPEELRLILEPQGIRAVIVYPMVHGNKITGFIGFDENTRRRHWTKSELEFLRTVTGIIANAYERKNTQERLKSSEENFRLFFNTIDDIILVATLDGKVLFANKATNEKLQYTKEEIQNMTILNFHPSKYAAEATKIFGEMINNTRNYCPLPLQIKNGEYLKVETRIWLGKWDGQDCIFGLCKDLSKEYAALEKFNSLFENNPALMAVSSATDRKFIDVNAAFLNTLGFKKEEVIGKTSEDLNLFEMLDKQKDMVEQVENKVNVQNRELAVRAKNGELLNGLFSGTMIDNLGEKLLLTVMVDITEQTKLKHIMIEQKERLENILKGTNAGTWEWNVKTGAVVFNERWANIVGYTLKELEPVSIDTWMRLAHPEDLVESERLLKKVFAGELIEYKIEARLKHKNGNWVWVLDQGNLITRDENGAPELMIGTHIDINNLKQTEELLKEISIKDPLTDIYNMRYIYERLKELIEENKRNISSCAVALLDIDLFKSINDSYGHIAGDHILKDFAKILKSNLRPYDLLGRYGGEEFIIIFKDLDKHKAIPILNRILRDVRQTIFVEDNNKIHFTFSGGVMDMTEKPKDGDMIEGLIKIADKRLYKAKVSGRNKIIID